MRSIIQKIRIEFEYIYHNNITMDIANNMFAGKILGSIKKLPNYDEICPTGLESGIRSIVGVQAGDLYGPLKNLY